MEHSEQKKKTGYLNQNFRLFHIKDKTKQQFDFHYHDFNKIIIFLSGSVTYLIEGKSYYLKPWDILLVNHNDVHRPVIDPEVTYERIVIWLKPEYVAAVPEDDCDILSCFSKANERSFNLIRLDVRLLQKIQGIIMELETALDSDAFGSTLLSDSLFMQLMVYLNRIFLGKLYLKEADALKYDPQIEKILKYINTNLTKDLSNDKIAETFYLSKYHLMHKFKEETGYTIHHYILQKRLILSAEMIKSGMPIMRAAKQSGFKDYSSFLRAFRKMYHKSPKHLLVSSDQSAPPAPKQQEDSV